MKDLEPGHCYYIVVTAVNEFGEGYKAKPCMVRTMDQDVDNERYSVYVWGNNASSEIGLSDDQVIQNMSYYKKFTMGKPLRNQLFQRESVL